MQVWLGTSGWQYRDWRGRLYPADLPTSRWLEHYAERFRTVEVNNTFYRLPGEEVFADWRRRTPDDAVIVVKASRYLSHLKRLRDPEEPVDRLMERAAALGTKLGPILLQLPPRMAPELERLDHALDCFDRHGARVAVEVRDPRWHVDGFYEVLARHGSALCLADRRNRRQPVRWTADWTYLRLHEGTAAPPPRYGDAALGWWARTLAAAPASVREAWVFFNNDPGGWAVTNASTFGRLATRAGLDVTRFPASSPRVPRGA